MELDKKIAEWLGMDRVPHFSRSIGLCFKYIEPKIDKSFDIYISRHYDRPGFSCAIQNITLKPRFQPIFSSAETPALAFCRAVGKLIDG